MEDMYECNENTQDISLTVIYKGLKKKFLIESTDVMIQLKMLICAKFKILNVSRLLLFKATDLNENEIKYDDLIEADDNDVVISFAKDQDIILCDLKQKDEDSEIKHTEVLSTKEQLTEVLKEKMSNNVNQEKSNIPIINNEVNKYHLVSVCSCEKDDASNVCLKCNVTMCENCKKRDHYLHLNEILKISKFKEYVKQKMITANEQITNKIFDDETFIYLQNFDFNFKFDLERIDKSFTFMKSLLEELKELQINYMVEMNNQMSFKSKFEEVQDKVKEINTYYSVKIGKKDDLNEENICNDLIDNKSLDELTPVELLNEKINCDLNVENSLNKYKYLCSLFQIYISAISTIETLNSDMIGNVKEVLKQAQGPFNIPNLNLQIQKFLKGGVNKKNKYFNDQVVMRFISYNSILQFKPKAYIKAQQKQLNSDSNEVTEMNIKKLKIPENDNFKLNFQNSDEIEINVDNKLFIVTGKKSNMFFCYDYCKNEINQLEDLKHSHQYGGLFYSPDNNSIYCVAGINSKKCEIYRNDELIFPSYVKSTSQNEQSIYNNNNINNYNKPKHFSWMLGPELNVYRQEFAGIVFNNYLYIFFGFNNLTSINNNTVERLNVTKNDKWELMTYANPSNLTISLSGHGCIRKSDTEILIFGGFDGKNYRDSIFLLNTSNFSFFATNSKIPNLKKYGFYQFFKQSSFCEITLNEYNNNDAKSVENKDKCLDFVMFDSKNLLHYINIRKFKYEIVDDFRKIDK